MVRRAINPENNWAKEFQFHQGEIIEETQRLFYISGQISAESDSTSPMGVSIIGKGNQKEQLIIVLKKIDTLLEKAEMSRKNLIQIRFYTVDIQNFMENYNIYASWIQEAGIKPTNSVIGVTGIAHPDAMIEIEAVAAQ